MGEDGCTGADYEQLRQDNIRRNNEMLRSLGLLTSSNSLGVLADLQRREAASGAGGGAAKQAKKKKKKAAAKRPRPQDAPDGTARRSRRLRGEKAELQGAEVDEWLEQETYRAEAPIEERIEASREAKLRAANEVAKAGADAAAMENPTASYEHTLMRVRSMSEKRLATRVKVIERAAGKHCVVKMALFAMVLRDEGYPDLAELATEALERLKALAPPA